MEIETINENIIIRKGDVTYKYNACSAPFCNDLIGSYYNGEMVYNASGIVSPIVVIRVRDDFSTTKAVSKIELYFKTFFDIFRNYPSMFIKVIDFINVETNLPDTHLRFLIAEPFNGIRLSSFFDEKGLDVSESFTATHLRQEQKLNREMFAAKIMEGILKIVEVLHQNHILLKRIAPEDFYVYDNFEVKMFYDFSNIFLEQRQGQFCGNVSGTYSSPEVILGDTNGVNESSDTYSLGLLLYHLSTGEEPFLMNGVEAVNKQLTGKIQIDKIKDRWLRSIVEKATSKKQDNRYNNATSMYEALGRLYQQKCCNAPNAVGSSFVNILFSPISMVANLACSLFSGNRSSKKITSEKEEKQYESFCSVFAPTEVKPKSRMMVQVYLHLNEETEKVKALATEADKNAVRRDYIPLQTKLKKGDKVDVVLNINGDKLLYDSSKSIIWQGSFCKCAFDYLVPSDLDVDELSCSVNLYVNGAIVGEMLFYTQIVDSPAQLNANVIAKPVKKLFISYSHNDLKSAEKIAKLYEGMDVDVFFDKHRLKSGYIYSEEIFNFINKADTFVLCWSENAAQSEYVEKERKAALELAYPNCRPREDAQISIKPYNIRPYATPPKDMIEHYHFEEL